MNNRITDDLRALCGVSGHENYNDFGEYSIMRGRVAEECDKIDQAFKELENDKIDADIEHNCLKRVLEKIVGEDCSGMVCDDMEQEAIQELEKRLMPKSYEWPRFEDGEQVRVGDEADFGSACGAVNSVELQKGGYFIVHICDGAEDHYHSQYFPGERVKRPASKVLDADGVEIRVGDKLYDTETGCARIVRAINASGTVEFEGHKNCGWNTKFFTHRAPVLAADGEPLREGETVWDTNGDELQVLSIEDDHERHVKCHYEDIDGIKANGWWLPHTLTHERPDSWGRLEADANASTCIYFGASTKDCGDCDHGPWECSYDKARDLVRRAKALCERGVE